MLKKLSIFVLTAVLAFPVFAQKSFEGKIAYKITTENSQTPQKMNYYLKDGKVRMEISQMPGYMLVIDSVLTVVMPMQKMYMQMDMKNNPNVKTSPVEGLKGKPKATGNKKTILGYECEEYILEDSSGTVKVWGTEEFTNFPGFDGSGKDEFAELMGKENFFPMLIETENNGAKIKVEVTEIKKEKLNDKLFQTPEGYKKVDMPGM